MNYNLCVTAQNRFDKACSDFTDTEKVYGRAQQIQEKINKLQNTIDVDTIKDADIEAVYKVLDADNRGSIQELVDQVKVPILRSSVSDSRPMLSESQMNEMLERTFRCSDKVQEVTSSKNGDYGHMTSHRPSGWYYDRYQKDYG